MADLVTHTCVAWLLKPSPRGRATFVLGTCVPDLLGRVPSMGLTTLRWSVHAIPEWTIYVWSPFHMPIGVLASSALIAFFFPEDRRRTAFGWLVAGGLLHLAVDLLQRHFGVGYLLLFPFSWMDFEIGWIGSEDTVRIVPFLVPLTLLVAWYRRRRDARAGPGRPDRA